MMTTIILCGDKNDKNLHRALSRALRNYAGGSTEIRPLSADSSLKQARFSIHDCEKIPAFLQGRGIIVFKNSFSGEGEKLKFANFVPVFCAHNQKAAEVLEGTGKTAITCGTAARDTLSVASIDFPKAVLSLQRDVKTIFKDILEPHEFKVHLQKQIALDDLLISCMVLLLLGIPSAEGYDL